MFLPVLNNAKDLDPSYKMDLDFWNCFGRNKHCFTTEEIRYLLNLFSILNSQEVSFYTVITLNIGTPRPATVVVLNIP